MSSEQARLLERARRIAQLRHPNLVRMLPMPGGAGLAPTLTQGRRLADFTPSGTFKRFELEQVVRLLLDVLSGLSALHEDVEDGVGFVHGEVAPQHIYVGSDGTARLVPLLSRHWMPGTLPNANGYAAPEFLLSSHVDPRADLFSVGVMLGEALTGRALFPDPLLDAVLARLLSGKLLPLLPPPQSRWALPLGAIAERAISPYPELRFRSAVELSNAIGAAVAPRLAEREADAWQTESPTLVQVPRPALADSRRLTPMATVLEIEAAPSEASQLEPGQQPGGESLGRRRLSARSRRWLVALSAAAVAAATVLMRPAPRAEQPLQAAAPNRAEVPELAAPLQAVVSAQAALPLLAPPAASGEGAVTLHSSSPSNILRSEPSGATTALTSRKRSPKPTRPDDYGF